jgi:hypothetical protein
MFPSTPALDRHSSVEHPGEYERALQAAAKERAAEAA